MPTLLHVTVLLFAYITAWVAEVLVHCATYILSHSTTFQTLKFWQITDGRADSMMPIADHTL